MIMNRRQSLALLGATVAASFARAQPGVSNAPAAASGAAVAASPINEVTQRYRARLESATPQSVLEWLKAGNDRFRNGRSTQGEQNKDARARLVATSPSQRGIAVVVSCIDSRVSPELLLDAGIGDLYTVRVGANVIGEDALGSVEVAVASDAKIVLMLGQTRCSGVRAACANVELEHFTQLLNKVRPAITKANALLDVDKTRATEIGERAPTNPRYISLVSQHNARWQAEQILARSQTVRDAVSKGETWLIAALYDVDTGSIAFEAPLKVVKPT
jgi:carbonic anhydrase